MRWSYWYAKPIFCFLSIERQKYLSLQTEGTLFLKMYITAYHLNMLCFCLITYTSSGDPAKYSLSRNVKSVFIWSTFSKHCSLVWPKILPDVCVIPQASMKISFIIIPEYAFVKKKKVHLAPCDWKASVENNSLFVPILRFIQSFESQDNHSETPAGGCLFPRVCRAAQWDMAQIPQWEKELCWENVSLHPLPPE